MAQPPVPADDPNARRCGHNAVSDTHSACFTPFVKLGAGAVFDDRGDLQVLRRRSSRDSVAAGSARSRRPVSGAVLKCPSAAEHRFHLQQSKTIISNADTARREKFESAPRAGTAPPSWP